MSTRALYLEAGHDWRVRLDGPALRIDRPGRAVSYHALTQLSRIVSATDSHWETTALLACLRAGVPVVFCDGHGSVQGCCYGLRQRETTLADLLAQAMGDADWETDFELWWYGTTQQAIRRVLERAHLRIHRVHPLRARGSLCNHHHRRLGFAVGPLLNYMRASAWSIAAAELQRQLNDPWYLGYPRPGVCLTTLAAEWLQWPLHEVLLRQTSDSLDACQPAHEAARLVENHRRFLTLALQYQLQRLEWWLREYVQ